MAILHTICMFCSLERYLELDLIRKNLPVGFTSHGTVSPTTAIGVLFFSPFYAVRHIITFYNTTIRIPRSISILMRSKHSLPVHYPLLA